MGKFVVTTSARIDTLKSKINNIKQDKFTSYYVIALKEEIKNLQSENKELRERNVNIAYIMSDLDTKLNVVKNKKKSLICILKLL